MSRNAVECHHVNGIRGLFGDRLSRIDIPAVNGQIDIEVKVARVSFGKRAEEIHRLHLWISVGDRARKSRGFFAGLRGALPYSFSLTPIRLSEAGGIALRIKGHPQYP